MKKLLQIGNYPPPMCGWAIQTKLVTDELRHRGHICEVLKINENREIKSPEYVDVQNGRDYFLKILRYGLRGYRLNVHVNGQSRKGYLLALAATLVGRLLFQPALVTFHGGLSQMYFPRHDSFFLKPAFWFLFWTAGGVACDDMNVKSAIEQYGIRPEKVAAIETFSSQYLSFQPAELGAETDQFLSDRDSVFFCYVSFRPEYRLEVLREAMSQFRRKFPQAGFAWLGFPEKEMPAVRDFVSNWPEEERRGLLLTGNLTHEQFLTLMTRSYACIRTPACDGVAASVLEALALRVPVVASENGRRPAGVICYEEMNADDLCAKLIYLVDHYHEIRSSLGNSAADDNIGRMADWLTGTASSTAHVEVVHAS